MTKALGRESPQPCSKPTVCAALTCSAPHHPPETSGTRGAQAKGQLCHLLCCEWSGNWGTALVVQGLRVPADAETQVRSLVQEGSACHRAPEPGHHNCWAWALEPVCPNRSACMAQNLGPATREATVMRRSRSATRDQTRESPQDSVQPKKKNEKKWKWGQIWLSLPHLTCLTGFQLLASSWF